MEIKMNTNGWLFIIGARNNTPLSNVKEIFETKFNSNPKKLKELEDEIQTLRNTQLTLEQVADLQIMTDRNNQ